MSIPDTSRARFSWLPAAVAAAAVVVALLAYWPALGVPFFPIDDPHYVTANTALQQVSLLQWWRFFATPANPWEYLPLRDLSYRIDLALFGLQPAGFRVHNLALYGLTCAAVWWFAVSALALLRGRAADGDRWIAAVATALFAAHPAHVESVIWISGRKDVLSGLFAVLSLAAFASALVPDAPSWRKLGASYLLFGCAILSKSSVVPVPLVAWLMALAREDWKTQPRFAVQRATTYVLPLFILALVSVVLQVGVSSAFALEPFDGMGVRSVADRLLLAIRILGTLAGIAVFPLHPRLIYDVEPPGDAGVLITAFGVIAVLVTAAGAWLSVRRRSALWLGLAMTGILAAPFLQLIPFYTWSYASERFVFLPVLGLSLAVAVGAGRLRPGPRSAAVAILLALAIAGTALRAWQWRDVRALFADAARQAPRHYAAVELGIRYVLVPDHRFADARAAADGVRAHSERAYLLDYVDAQEALTRSDLATLRRVVPPLMSRVSREDLGRRIETANLALQAGLLAEAERAYRGILADFREGAPMRYNLGLALKRQGRATEAVDAIQAAIDAGYGTAEAWNNLGLACRDAGRTERAVTAFQQALAADPHHWHAAYNLARLRWALGDRDGAKQALHEARARAVLAGASTAPLDELERQLESSAVQPR